jgi:hypothetical protein
MRSMLILLAGCLPLAVLTVRSFVELGSIDERLGSPNPTPNIEVDAGLPASLRAEAQREEPAADALAEADLIAGAALPGIEDVGNESVFRPLGDDWAKWTAAREMVAALLPLERVAASVGTGQLDRIALDQFDDARRQIEAARRECQQAKDQYEQLRQRYQKSSARGTVQLIDLLDRRIAALAALAAQCDQRLEAAGLLRDARTAFQPGNYGECVSRCDELLAQHASILPEAVASKVRVLRDRARFWDDYERLTGQLSGAAADQRERLLTEFLANHNDPASQTPDQQRVVAQCQEKLLEVKREIEAERANREAQAAIRKLEQALPPDFDQRLRSSARIADSYPTEMVKTALRANVKQWLREFLPEKQIAESPQLEEAETTRREIIRGYFAEVKAGDGTLFGYKRYPTPQALADPDFDVGTYRKEEFLVPPGESVPRRCVRQYDQARNRLIEDPGRRAGWVELAELCDSLEAELAGYRNKKGASQDDADLSFAQQARFARAFVGGSGWADIETLFGS